MPKQEVFLTQQAGDRKVEVIKTYDQTFAREAFGNLSEEAQALLWNALGIDENYDPSDVPPPSDPDTNDFLWEELLEAAREDGSLLSFFVVTDSKSGSSKNVYVCPDWPSAEGYAKSLIAGIH
jgi:hypothetical protein